MYTVAEDNSAIFFYDVYSGTKIYLLVELYYCCVGKKIV